MLFSDSHSISLLCPLMHLLPVCGSFQRAIILLSSSAIMEFLADQNGILYEESYRAEEEERVVTLTNGKVPASDVKISNTTVSSLYENQRRILPVSRNTVVPAKRALIPEKLVFSCSPPEVAFKDFEVGKTYSVVLRVTNTSTGFATFRVKPLPASVRNVLSVQYEFPGRIPAGLSWPVTIIFSPNANCSFVSTLSLNTEAGVLQIPVAVKKKEALISVGCDDVDFGTVAVGESKKVSVIIKNLGALATEVSLSGSFTKLLSQVQASPVTKSEHNFFSVNFSQPSVFVRAFNEYEIVLTFSPLEEYELDCYMDFSTSGTGEPGFKHSVQIHGKGTGLPVYVQNPDIDFQCCFYGKKFYSAIRVANSSSMSAQVSARIPSFLRECVWIEPEHFAIQPNSTYEAVIAFMPNETLGQSIDAIIELPVKGQALPCCIRVLAQLTASEINVDTNDLYFGKCLSTEEKELCISVKNESSLPQTVSFDGVPSNVFIHPSTATLLPVESLTFAVRLTAPQVGQLSQCFTVRGQFGSRVLVNIAAESITSALALSESALRLPLCCTDGMVSANVVLTNLSTMTRNFEFSTATPFLRLSPSQGMLEPHSSVPVTVLLSPSFTVVQNNAHEVLVEAPKTTKQKKNATKVPLPHDEECDEGKNDSEPVQPNFSDWDYHQSAATESWHRSFTVRCTSHSSDDDECIYLAVRCAVAQPAVVARVMETSTPVDVGEREVPVSHGKVARGTGNSPPAMRVENSVEAAPIFSSRPIVDFGDVAINSVSRKTCLIWNKGVSKVSQYALLSSCTSAFAMMRPPRLSLQPSREDTLILAFNPRRFGSFSATVKLSTDANDVFFQLRGRCQEVDVGFKVISSNENQGSNPAEVLAFPPTVLKSGSEVTTQLTNNGSFPIRCDVTFPDAEDDSRYSCTQPFACHATQCTIPAKGSAVTRFFFRPQRSGKYSSSVCITAGKFTKSIELTGLGTDRSIYLLPPTARFAGIRTDDDRSMTPVPPCAGASEDYPLQLSFVRGETKVFVAGSIKDGPASDCVVEGWEDGFSMAGWSINSTKQSISSGTEVQVTVSLKDADVSVRALDPYCRFRIVMRCPSDPSCDQILFLICSGL